LIDRLLLLTYLVTCCRSDVRRILQQMGSYVTAHELRSHFSYCSRDVDNIAVTMNCLSVWFTAQKCNGPPIT